MRNLPAKAPSDVVIWMREKKEVRCMEDAPLTPARSVHFTGRR